MRSSRGCHHRRNGSSRWSPTVGRTARSATSSIWPRRRSRTTSRASCPSSRSLGEPRPPRTWPGTRRHPAASSSAQIFFETLRRVLPAAAWTDPFAFCIAPLASSFRFLVRRPTSFLALPIALFVLPLACVFVPAISIRLLPLSAPGPTIDRALELGLRHRRPAADVEILGLFVELILRSSLRSPVRTETAASAGGDVRAGELRRLPRLPGAGSLLV